MVDFGTTYHRQCLTTHSDGDTAERERGEGALPCVLGQDDDTAGRSLVSVTALHLIQLPCSYHGLALLAGYLALSV